MTPLRTLRLNDKAGVKTGLLMSGRTKVIVREDCAEGAIDACVIQYVIGEPALNCRLRAKRTEERMWFSFRARVCAVARIT